MRREHWPVKVGLAVFGVLLVLADYALPGAGVSSGALLLVAVLTLVDALIDRERQVVERRWAEEDREAKATADRAERARDAEVVAEAARERRRIFKGGKDLGFLIASFAANRDLLKLKDDFSPSLRENLEARQREILAEIAALRREFSELDDAGGA